MNDLCECFTALIKSNIVSFYESDGIMLMPYIRKTHFRFNTCPCCGINTRDLQLTRNELFDLL